MGYNYRLSNLAAALGVAQLEQLPELLAARRRMASGYDEVAASLPALRPAPHAAWADPSYWLYTAALDPSRTGVTRDELLAGLSAAAIEARPVWTPLHLTRLYRDAPRLGGGVAESIFATALSLPSSASLTAERQGRVAERLRELLGKSS